MGSVLPSSIARRLLREDESVGRSAERNARGSPLRAGNVPRGRVLLFPHSDQRQAERETDAARLDLPRSANGTELDTVSPRPLSTVSPRPFRFDRLPWSRQMVSSDRVSTSVPNLRNLTCARFFPDQANWTSQITLRLRSRSCMASWASQRSRQRRRASSASTSPLRRRLPILRLHALIGATVWHCGLAPRPLRRQSRGAARVHPLRRVHLRVSRPLCQS